MVEIDAVVKSLYVGMNIDYYSREFNRSLSSLTLHGNFHFLINERWNMRRLARAAEQVVGLLESLLLEVSVKSLNSVYI